MWVDYKQKCVFLKRNIVFFFGGVQTSATNRSKRFFQSVSTSNDLQWRTIVFVLEIYDKTWCERNVYLGDI